MNGLHLCADLGGCAPNAPSMRDPDSLRALCVHAVREAGLGAVAELFHCFSPVPGQELSGITGVVLLAESHLAVHTWPELGAVTLDVYVCNLSEDNAAKAEALLARLQQAFSPRETVIQRIERGRLGGTLDGRLSPSR